MNTAHGIIYLTDKNGKQDKTRQIKRIQFDESKNIYLVTFENSETVFHYKPENVEIIRNIIYHNNTRVLWRKNEKNIFIFTFNLYNWNQFYFCRFDTSDNSWRRR